MDAFMYEVLYRNVTRIKAVIMLESLKGAYAQQVPTTFQEAVAHIPGKGFSPALSTEDLQEAFSLLLKASDPAQVVTFFKSIETCINNWMATNGLEYDLDGVEQGCTSALRLQLVADGLV